MPPNTAPPSPPRRIAAIAGLVLAVALACLAFALHRRGAPAQAAASTAPSASARAHRSRAPVALAARPRAGISGHVLDMDRQPVAGASVCAWAPPGGGLITAETQAPRCAKTDTAGAYALADLFPATALSLSASAQGFAPTGYRATNGDAELRLADGEQRAGVDIVFRAKGVALKGIVDDVTGGVVSGAFVTSKNGIDWAVGTSDAKGEFTLWVEPGSVSVGATASGYAPGWAHGPAPDHFFKIHLMPGATLVGHAVIAGSEEPVAGVFVEGIQVEGGYSRSSARTDGEGRFRVEGLSPGRYRVEATSEGREGYSKSSTTLGLGETSSEIVIEMDPAYVVRGRVVDKKTKEPCKGGEVVITDPKQNEFSRADIDPQGWARMASVIPGTYRVDVRCNDHVPRDDYPTLTVKDRDAPTATWEVDKGAAVRVEVTDAQGQRVKKATVWASSSGPDSSSGSADHPETDGTFLVAGLKAGTYQVSANTADGGRGHAEAKLSADGEERVRIEVPSAGIIDGVVEDDGHKPVPGVRILVAGPQRTMAQSLDDGTFSVIGLPSGEYELRPYERGASRNAKEGADPRTVKVTVSAPDHAKVKVTVEARRGTIEGRVTDGAGKPVTDAFIEAYGDNGRSGSGSPIVTDTDGHFTVEGLADGEYTLHASRKGGGEAKAENVKVGTRTVALKIGDGGSIAGTLTARNSPVERFTLDVRQTNGSFHRNELFFHAQGAFSVGDLPAGTYQVVADSPDGSATTEVTLAEGEQKTGVLLSMTLRVSLDGRLVDLERGTPIAGLPIFITGNSPVSLMNGDNHNNKSGPDGRFHLEGVVPGTWGLTVSSSDPSYDSINVPVVVPEGGSADIGSIRIPRHRIGPGEPQGNLGLYVDWDSREVRGVSGAADEAGIQTGDVIVSVDGFDVQGNNRYLYQPLTTVPVGRAVSLGLSGGRTVTVVARGF